MTSKWTSDHIPDQTGRTAIVTGANSGIGFEMARALTLKNTTVILACRNTDKGETAVRQINQDYPQEQAQFMQLDLADLASGCRFGNCSHRHEPGCAVQDGLAQGTIAASRYQSYVKIYEEMSP